MLLTSKIKNKKIYEKKKKIKTATTRSAFFKKKNFMVPRYG